MLPFLAILSNILISVSLQVFCVFLPFFLSFHEWCAGGKYSLANGTAEWHALDTNDDGWVDMADDPYTPFYPGDQWVDWVGLNMYHMGQVTHAYYPACSLNM